jgi:hypothetical protein
MSRWLVSFVVLASLGSGCGSRIVGDCSGGRLEGSTCVSTQPTVHWTADRATAAATRFTYAPMVRGKLTDVRCQVVARFPAHEATAVCTGRFVSPNSASRRVTVAFSLSGIGVVNPDCSRDWRSSPYCSGRNHMVTKSS